MGILKLLSRFTGRFTGVLWDRAKGHRQDHHKDTLDLASSSRASSREFLRCQGFQFPHNSRTMPMAMDLEPMEMELAEAGAEVEEAEEEAVAVAVAGPRVQAQPTRPRPGHSTVV